jgi:serine/threonine protein phosphatase PrpC
VVVASDGVLDVLHPSDVARVVALNRPDPDAAARAVVEDALSHGAHDNCTAVVIYFQPQRHQEEQQELAA